MSDNFGILYDKVEIKVLILFVMSRLAEPVTMDILTELTMCDESISYFDVTECITKLVKTKHLNLSDNKYSLTAKGLRNGEILEKDLPFSVRIKADEATSHIRAALSRNSMIKTASSPNSNGGFNVCMSVSDGIGDILSLNLYIASKEQADRVEKGFRKNAEKVYHDVIEVITK